MRRLCTAHLFKWSTSAKKTGSRFWWPNFHRKVAPIDLEKPEPMGKSKWRCKSSPQPVGVEGHGKTAVHSTVESSSQIFFCSSLLGLIYMNFPREPWNGTQNDTQSTVDVGINWNLYKLVGGFDSTHLGNMLVKMHHSPNI